MKFQVSDEELEKALTEAKHWNSFYDSIFLAAVLRTVIANTEATGREDPAYVARLRKIHRHFAEKYECTEEAERPAGALQVQNRGEGRAAVPPPGRQLDMEQIHEIAMVVSDALETYIERAYVEGHKGVGFLEMKIGVINALECLFQYQHKIMIVGRPPQTEGERGAPG